MKFGIAKCSAPIIPMTLGGPATGRVHVQMQEVTQAPPHLADLSPFYEQRNQGSNAHRVDRIPAELGGVDLFSER